MNISWLELLALFIPTLHMVIIVAAAIVWSQREPAHGDGSWSADLLGWASIPFVAYFYLELNQRPLQVFAGIYLLYIIASGGLSLALAISSHMLVGRLIGKFLRRLERRQT